jgi:hypothetical protein
MDSGLQKSVAFGKVGQGASIFWGQAEGQGPKAETKKTI